MRALLEHPQEQAVPERHSPYFAHLRLREIRLPFVDSVEKARLAVEQRLERRRLLECNEYLRHFCPSLLLFMLP